MQGYVCCCFYERNIYLKSLDLHVTFTGNEADFRSSYAKVKRYLLMLSPQNCDVYHHSQ